MPHLSYEIDQLKEGDTINAMIVENRMDSKHNPRLIMTLKNSKIRDA